MDVNLFDFIKTGKFGLLGLGSPIEAIIANLGEAENWTEPAPPTIWKYGNVEIMLTNSGIVCVELTFRGGFEEIWPTIGFLDFSQFHPLSSLSFEKLVRYENIPFHHHKTTYCPFGIFLFDNNVPCVL